MFRDDWALGAFRELQRKRVRRGQPAAAAREPFVGQSEKKGIQRNAIGRSRGGFTTKLHTRTDAQGLAIGFCLTPDQASDMDAYQDLMLEEAPGPAEMLADKGYGSDAIRDDLDPRGADPG